MGVPPRAGWFRMDNPIKMDDLGVLLFQETSNCVFMHYTTPTRWYMLPSRHCETRLTPLCLAHPGMQKSIPLDLKVWFLVRCKLD